MRIATWNVNSVKQRIDNLHGLARRSAQPDIVCLQEIKCVDEAFPREPIEALGYNVAVHGQKTFNGVAHPVQAAVRRGDARGCPATPATTMPASSRRWSRPRPARCGWRRSICPTAIPPAPKNIHTNSNGWTGLLHYAHERLEAGGAAGPGRRLQRHPGAGRRPQPRRPGSTTRCSCRRPASSSAR